MALYRCLKENGLRIKELKTAQKQNSAVFENMPFAQSSYNVRILILKSASVIRFLICLTIRTISLLPQWTKALFRFCPHAKRFPRPQEFLITGHRGNPVKAVENTIEACDKAVNIFKANAVEIDICLTKDKKLILWHDWDPNDLTALVRQFGLEPVVKYKPFVPVFNNKWRKSVNKLTLDEIRTHYGYTSKKGRAKKMNIQIPTLDSFFVWAVHQSKIKAVFLDVKVPETEPGLAVELSKLTAGLLEKYKPKFKLILLSPEANLIKAMQKVNPQLNYSLDVILPFGLVLDPAAFSAVRRARELNNSNASAGRPTDLEAAPWSTYRRLITHDRYLMENLPAEAEESLYAWTINKRRELSCLVKLGVDGILTDKPKVLKKIADKQLH